MDTTTERRALEIFARISPLEPHRRQAELERVCGKTGLLRRAVEELIRSDCEDSFLGRDHLDFEGFLERLGEAEESKHPESIGPFRVLRLLGMGGMGIVYEAEQTQPSRRVAVKVMRPSVMGSTARRLFEAEVRTLASLQHPGIAHIYDVGLLDTMEGATPYFSMELVTGSNLVEFANAQRLGLVERLRLFLRVCDAIQYAHQNGIMHRDLKPGNIIVDETGQPRVLDFGIARAASGSDEPEVTDLGRGVGTLAYMSPEQARGERSSVDTRTDVFSLGVVLCELLTGDRPFVEDRSWAEDPQWASGVLGAMPADLRSVIRKAVEVDVPDRYQTVHDFGADVNRFLRNEPVTARRATLWYQLRKLASRHIGAVVGAVSAILVLLTALAVTISALRSETEANAASKAALDRAEVAQFAAESRELETRALLARKTLNEQLAAIETLWPRRPWAHTRMEQWLDSSYHLLEQARDFEHRLDITGAAASKSGLDDEFVNRLLSDLDEFRHSAQSGIPLVERRLQDSNRIEATTTVEITDLWEEVNMDLFDDSRFDGFELDPQVGLHPLGKEPSSGLWEFALIESGEIPNRDDEGYLVIDGSSAIVFILLPGSEFWMGAERPHAADAVGHNRDAEAHASEGPVHQAQLDPFMLSKYEMTQGQWLRIMKENPSLNGAGFAPGADKNRHPVESLTRVEAQWALFRYGLQFPTEAQWEYAARGGQETPYYTGSNARQLRRYENIPDPSRRSYHHPVGSYLANPYGFHDMLGNVVEWCEDQHVPYSSQAPIPGDGYRGPESWRTDWTLPMPAGELQRRSLYVQRGGSFRSTPAMFRCGARLGSRAVTISPTIGVRPAYRIRTTSR